MAQVTTSGLHSHTQCSVSQDINCEANSLPSVLLTLLHLYIHLRTSERRSEMMKAFWSVSVSLLLLSWSDSLPLLTADAAREMLELLQAVTAVDQLEDLNNNLMVSPNSERFLYDSEELKQKRGLPRLGVSIHRALPSRVYSRKSAVASRYHMSSPAKWMSILHG